MTRKKAEKPRVGMILERDFPPDDRPEKEALSLIENGFEVHLLCYSKSKNYKKSENYHGIKISRFHIPYWIVKKFGAAYLVLPFYRFIWKRQIKKFIAESRPDVVHIHDLPMTDIVINLAAKTGFKVVCDQHEYWSNWIVNTAHYNTFPGKIVKRLGNWKKFERTYLNQADLVITVTDKLRELYISEVGINEDKIITVPNTPHRRWFNSENIDTKIVEKYKNDFMIFYAGAIDVLRGVDIVIKSLPRLRKHIPNIRFVVAGRVAARMKHPLELAKELGVASNVEFLGWLTVDKLASYIAASKICVFVPHPVSREINNTIATKIYQYMAMGKPIVTSSATMMREFVEKNGLGLAVSEVEEGTVSEAIEKIHRQYGEFRKSAESGSKKLLKDSPVFWDQTIEPMVEFYKKRLT